MGQRILISVADVSAVGELNDSATALAVCQALPIEAQVNIWGNEIYFPIGVECPLAPEAREAMAVGEMAYWPPGQAFCIFFGPTPVSGHDGAPKAAGKVNPIGRISGNPAVFQNVTDGEKIRISLQN